MRKSNALILLVVFAILVPSFVLPGYCRQDDSALAQLNLPGLKSWDSSRAEKAQFSSSHGLKPEDFCEGLKSELKKEGVSDEFIRATESQVKRMIASQATIADIKTVLLDLWHEGVKGRALKNAVASVAELVASGDNTLEAARIASTAAHKAEAEGLSGFGIGMRVKKAVQDRKAFLKSLKK